jgi:arginine decarboxylase-like protein
MSDGEKLLRLIEEMVELKVQLHAGLPVGSKPELVQLVAKKRHEDMSRLDFVRGQIVALIDG